MVLYHGSTITVQTPEIRTSKTFLDFGNGFYTTTSYHQAHRWAMIKMRRENLSTAFVSVYDFDFEKAVQSLIIKKFDTADSEWLDFVSANRRGEQLYDCCDMHIGPVADDNIYQTIRLFETGILSASETVKRLKTEVLHDQWTFHTEQALAHCHYRECIVITGGRK